MNMLQNFKTVSPYAQNNRISNNLIPAFNNPKKNIEECCEYCKESDLLHLFQCGENNCNRWFCNNNSVIDSKGSHIFHHLSLTSHKSVKIHKKNPKFSGHGLECEICKNSNIFSLGFIRANEKIVCREPCLRPFKLAVEDWIPFMIHKRINLNFVDFDPNNLGDDDNFNYDLIINHQNELQNTNIKLQRVKKIEEFYLNSVNRPIEEIRIRKIYENQAEYKKTFTNLLELDRLVEENEHFKTNLMGINFYFSENRRSGFIFGDELGCKFNFKQEILFSDAKGWDSSGKLCRVDGPKYFFQFKHRAPNYLESPSKLNLKSNLETSMNNRLIEGIKHFETYNKDEQIVEMILGKKSEVFLTSSYNKCDFSVPEMKQKLNAAQNSAIRNALKYKLSIVQGPPGTGKTEVISALCYNIIKLKNKCLEKKFMKKNINKMIFNKQKSIRDIARKANEIAITAVISCAEAEKFLPEIANVKNEKILKFENEIGKEKKMYEGILKEQSDEISAENFIFFSNVGQMNFSQQINLFQTLHIKIEEKCQTLGKIKSLENLIEKNSKIRLENLKKSVESYEPISKPSDTFDDYSESDANLVPDLNEFYSKSKKVLICASSNTAVKLLVDKVSKSVPKLIHVYAKCREKEYPNDPLSLHFQVNEKLKSNQIYQTLKERLKSIKSQEIEENNESSEEEEEDDKLDLEKIAKYIKILEKNNKSSGHLRKKIKKQLLNIKIEEGRKILSEADVVCCTCVTSSSNWMKNIEFQQVIIDEATQSLEPETILCLMKEANQVVLVGDIMQLGGVVKSKRACDLGLDVPMIERLLDNGVPNTLLNVQYRMHPMIAEFSNTYFYKGQIQNGVDIANRTYENFEFPQPIRNKPTFFYHIESNEESSGSGGSYLNRFEADTIKRLIFYMMSQNVPAEHIAVITFYDGQRGFLVASLEDSGPNEYEYLKKIEILSVDASQGREKEFIILSCVRANKGDGVGFLQEYRRLNVAMTRAIYGLVVCGNLNTLITDHLWENLIKYFNDRQLIFEGDIEELKLVIVNGGDSENFELPSRKKYQECYEDYS